MNLKKIAIALLCLVICSSLFACVENGNQYLPSVPVPPVAADTPTEGTPVLVLTVANSVFTVRLQESETVKQFVQLLPMTINMGELNGNEKYYFLQQNLPTSPQSIGEINSGDIMLYGSNCLVVFYEKFSTSYNYTKIGKIDNVAELTKALGRGNVTVEFSLE